MTFSEFITVRQTTYTHPYELPSRTYRQEELTTTAVAPTHSKNTNIGNDVDKRINDENQSPRRVCWAGLRGGPNDEGGMEARRDTRIW